ncbi:hypothetical protein GWK47_012033 [Chionoecetes opilio]|uniref:Chitin-binding type-2 domain-containing protein n=1 Tax=Chionoecetes opilio TaxID=41210 RepID=A0A8J4Y2G7_CHIOP|nr:hypothetical protein GWK47_012033 [Chionoecetes opilio]
MRRDPPTVLLLLFSLFVRDEGTEATFCGPDCEGKMEGDKVRDPSNCLQYYYCSDPEGNGHMVASDEPIICPDGSYFNAAPHVMDCDAIPVGTDYCVGLCNPCRLECSEPGILIADPMDCNAYKICLDEQPALHVSCPNEAPYFDYQANLCSDSPEYCYDLCDTCQTYCTSTGKVFDPQDCNGYYLCDPPILTHFSCPDEEVFNVETLVCEETSEKNCTSLC